METGIEKTKSALTAIIALGVGISEALKDEKVTAGEWVGLSLKGLKLVAALRDYGNIVTELKDLTETEQAELIEYVAEEFDIENDAAEAMIEQAFEVLFKFVAGFVR
jgi:hypothetical protein